MLCVQLANRRRFRAGKGDWAVGLIGVLFGLLCVCHFPQSIGKAAADMDNREVCNGEFLEIARYCEEHPENFYFEDVYSTVNFTQKLLEERYHSPANYDIMGGWLCKSPLYKEKLGQFGIASMEEGLYNMDNVYFISANENGTDWLIAYYAGKGMEVSVEQVDSIAGIYAVYQLRR